MSNSNTTTPPLAGAEGQSQADNQSSQAGDGAFSLEEAKKLRSENAQLRKRAKEAEDAKTTLENAKLSDQEKLVKERDALKAERDSLKSEAQTYKAQQAAQAAGALYPDMVASKIPAEAMADKRELDKVIAQLKAEYPALFNGRGSADGGAGIGGQMNTQNMNQMIRRAAGRG